MRTFLTLILFVCCSLATATVAAQDAVPGGAYATTSVFHTLVTDLNPPYRCQVKLRDASGVGLGPNTKHNYRMSGICSVKLPYGNTWIYQDLWVEINAAWDCESHTAVENTDVQGGDGNRGNINIVMRCDNDPWLTKAPCVIDTLANNTNFTNFGKVFNPRTGVYPPFVLLSGQYPPLARNQIMLPQAIAFSIASAQKEAASAEAAFAATFANKPPPMKTMTTTVSARTQIFTKPAYQNHRIDYCLILNKQCGKAAADRWCQVQGFKRSLNSRLDKNPVSPTLLLGSQSLCEGPICKGFDEIICGD